MVATAAHVTPAPTGADALPKGDVAAEDLREKAKRLISDICVWPKLAAILAEEARWRSEIAGADGLIDAGLFQHARGFSYHPHSPVARQITCHFLNKPGLLDADPCGRWWAVCGDAVNTSDSALGLSPGPHFAELCIAGDGCPLSSARRVVQTAKAQDMERAMQFLIWMTRLAVNTQTARLCVTPAEIIKAFHPGIQTPAEWMWGQVEDALAYAPSIMLRALQVPAGRWRFSVLHETPAIRVTMLRTDLIEFELSELLPMVLSRFMGD